MAEANPEPVAENTKASTPDGPRYVVSVQTEKDPCCHKDVYETEKLGDAQERAKNELQKVGRRILLYDRKVGSIIERFEAEPKSGESEPAPNKKPTKKSVKRK